MKNKNVYGPIKTIVLYIFITFKSFFLAVTNVAWGLLSLFAFNALIVYLYKSQGFDLTLIPPIFIMMEEFIINNILAFVFVFFVLCFYLEQKEIY